MDASFRLLNSLKLKWFHSVMYALFGVSFSLNSHKSRNCCVENKNHDARPILGCMFSWKMQWALSVTETQNLWTVLPRIQIQRFLTSSWVSRVFQATCSVCPQTNKQTILYAGKDGPRLCSLCCIGFAVGWLRPVEILRHGWPTRDLRFLQSLARERPF
jgi:hypothetical protein